MTLPYVASALNASIGHATLLIWFVEHGGRHRYKLVNNMLKAQVVVSSTTLDTLQYVQQYDAQALSNSAPHAATTYFHMISESCGLLHSLMHKRLSLLSLPLPANA